MVFIQWLIENGSVFENKSPVQLMLFHTKGFFFIISESKQLVRRKRARESEGKYASAVNKHSGAATRQLFTLFIEDSTETKKV